MATASLQRAKQERADFEEQQRLDWELERIEDDRKHAEELAARRKWQAEQQAKAQASSAWGDDIWGDPAA